LKKITELLRNYIVEKKKNFATETAGIVLEERSNNIEARNDAVIRRERDIQRQWEESKIKEARYNMRYYKLGKDCVKP